MPQLPSSEQTRGPKKMTLLMIDDDTISTCTHIRIAQKSGLFNEIYCFKNGKAALDFLHGSNGSLNAPDLILLKREMPDMSGIDFIHRLGRSEFPFRKLTRLVVLSMPANSARRIKAPEEMEFDLLTSPFLKYHQASVFSFHNLAIIMAPDPVGDLQTPAA